jgi:Rad3-related DNA helicase
MVFFPSYKMLTDVADVYEELYGQEEEVELLRQMPAMGEKEREAFLTAFREERRDTLIGFCVMGGIFSEGIDLTGERLIGALVVGTGLPQVSYERKILMDYYDKAGEKGFDYAYRIPGMNKVLQSAGRVIRTTEDRGIIALLDERFLYRESLELFPREWFPYETVNKDTAGAAAREFWKRVED